MLNVSRETIIIAVCGVLSGAIFSLAASSIAGGVLLIFLPVMPLAIVGLSLSARHCLFAAVIACATITLLSDAGYVLFFALFIVCPLTHFIRKCLLWRGDVEAKEWYPVLTGLSETTLLCAGVFMVFALTSVHAEHIELKTIVSGALSSQPDSPLKEADPAMSLYLKELADRWSFVIFAAAIWIWILLIYTFAILANTLLVSKHAALRPGFALAPHGLPLWLPAVLLVCGGLAFFGHGNDSFTGETLFLILLLPYFLSGIASVHKFAGVWRMKKFWLALFYCMLALFPWLAALLIARGIYTQMESFSWGSLRH